MSDRIQALSQAMGRANRVWDRAKQRAEKALGIQDPLRILPYRGYGTPEWVYIKGRVLEKEGIAPRAEDAGVWKNMVNMYRRFESDEIPCATVQASIGGAQQAISANREGYFEAELTLSNPLAQGSLWHAVDLRLLDPPPRKQAAVTAEGEVICVSPTAKFGVISDIDDTIVYTAANDVFKMIRIAYLGNERSRRPFAGVGPFYQALQQGMASEGNPIFYVSSSPWNMYDLFAKFMDLNDIPIGPILLRDIELSPANLLSFEHTSHKREQIDPIFKRFPDLPFILIGDSGQQDAEIYRQIVQDYPGRIRAIYIRDAVPDDQERHRQISAIAEQVRSAGVEFLLFSDTAAAAEHATAQGWIGEEAIAAVRADDGV
ncbi:MAG: phosphatase domain-containing protein [Phormidesmis sp.]